MSPQRQDGDDSGILDQPKRGGGEAPVISAQELVGLCAREGTAAVSYRMHSPATWHMCGKKMKMQAMHSLYAPDVP